MKEDFVHTVWKFQLLNKQEFTSVSGQSIRVVHPGFSHINAGPDFTTAKLLIDGILWIGNVEIHVNASEWYAHHHHLDPAYNNVILHVVFSNHHKICFTQNGLPLNTLVLAPYIDDEVLNTYAKLSEDMRVLPCKNWWNKIEKSIVEHWLERMCISRLEEKCIELKSRLIHLNEHWDQLFFEVLSRQLGFHVNALPMERLARSLPTELFQKNIDNPLFVEAILFGQAGMLNREFTDDYPNALKNEYSFLKTKYNLTAFDEFNWKFSRLRPQNFPTIRIAQLAAILQLHPRIFRECLTLNDPKEWYSFFDVTTHNYWDTHYVFDRSSTLVKKRIGAESLNQLLLNTLCSIWVLYGNVYKDPEYIQKALDLMNLLKVENNRYVSMFVETEYNFNSSVHSQGLRFLWEQYCNDKKCLTCSIGLQGLKIKL